MIMQLTQNNEKAQSGDIKILMMQFRSCIHLFIKQIDNLKHNEEPNYEKLAKLITQAKLLQLEIESIDH